MTRQHDTTEANASAGSSLEPLPVWARLLDAVGLLLLLFAVTATIFGGFRVRVGGIRLAIMSAPRALAWAVVVIAARHVLVRRRPLYQNVLGGFTGALRLPEWRSAFAVGLTTRLVIMLVGYLAVSTFGYPPGAPPFRLFPDEVRNLPVRWDSGWYMRVATEGYQWTDNPVEQQSIVFFPAYPMMIRFAGRLFLGSRFELYVLAAVAISVFAFVVALAYLFRLGRELLDDDHARAALWLIAAYPFALFFGAAYTEALFLVAAIGACFHAERGEYVQCGIWGLVAGLTRPNGSFLSLPLFLIVAAPWLPQTLGAWSLRARSRDARRLIPGLVAAAMPVVGVLAYSAYVYSVTGRPFAWAEGHAAWGRTYRGLMPLIADRVDYIGNEGLAGYVHRLPYDAINGFGVIFVLATAWPVARRVGLAYAAFILINILPPLAAGGLLSAGRLSAVIFPSFIWLASVVPVRHRAGWVATFAAFQALCAALFYTWRPLY